MDNRSGNAHRKNSLRALSRQASRGASEVLQRPLQGGVSRASAANERGGRRRSCEDRDAIDLTDYCQYCGKALPEGSHPTRKYCGQKCCSAVTIALDSAARREARSGRICPQCNGPVSDDKPAYTIYCCEACQIKGHAPRRRYRIYAKTCPVCSLNFETRHRSQCFCSKSCGMKAVWASGRMDHLRNRLSAARFDAMFAA